MNRDLPKRITPDAILEAIVEIRFSIDELPEVFLGRVLSAKAFQSLAVTRLPQADIPFSARESDPNLRFQPIYQLEGKGELVRLGTGVMSFHVVAPYCGWAAFRRRAFDIIHEAWSVCGNAPVERCGLRYVNALTADRHGVQNIDDLNLVVSVAGEKLLDVTVGFVADDMDNTETLVRVASARHVQGDIPPKTTFVVDVDVYTTGNIRSWDSQNIMEWLDNAHEIEKAHFFDLIPDQIIGKLQEE